MKCTIPEISWHNRDPVLSIDVQPGTINSEKNEISWRVATGGADSHILIWHVKINEVGAAVVTFIADLDRHQRAVNVVRFSPSGEILASGDDESAIILWKQKIGFEPPPLDSEENQNKEHWKSWKVLRGHLQDIYDISWSPDSTSLISGSVDNTAILWDIQKGKNIGIISEHKGFVQGVAWDPGNQYVCTLSTDRICRLIDINTKKTVQRVSKAKIPTPPGHHLEGQTVRLFHDDTFKSFFRRLTFSLDGALILAPSGIIEPQDSSEKFANTTIIFSRHNLREPIAVLPSLDESTIAIRCCPIYFELRDNGPASMMALPYRMVFAVATQKSVLIYDTQQTSPIAVVSNIHYTRLTDVSWSSDGQILVISSTDGYCSIVHFRNDELGKAYQMDKSISANNYLNNSKKISQKVSIKDDIVSDNQPFLDSDNNAMDIDIKKTNIESDDDGDVMAVDTALTKKTQNEVAKDKTTAETGKRNEIEEIIEETEDIHLVYKEESTVNDITNNAPAIEVTKTVAINSEKVIEKNSKDSKCTKHTPPKPEITSMTLNRTPRRVQLITLSSPKRTKKE
ncbi:chromatin assembly factor 1 subunit B [Cephus cinctus]|uniref:Chromatin assembly factor 1 subunit B n=1 Tax=Cephus cinctus TaxID=211228 RepID=A0AAJ7BN52_CEPCN|nr:chromatin assembly factor 1 subunit B [Cephus cinctus]